MELPNPHEHATTQTKLPARRDGSVALVLSIGTEPSGAPGGAVSEPEELDRRVQPLPLCVTTIAAEDVTDGAKLVACVAGAFHAGTLAVRSNPGGMPPLSNVPPETCPTFVSACVASLGLLDALGASAAFSVAAGK